MEACQSTCTLCNPHQNTVFAPFRPSFSSNQSLFPLTSSPIASYIQIHGRCEADTFTYLGKSCVIVRGNILPVSLLPASLSKHLRRFVTYEGRNYALDADLSPKTHLQPQGAGISRTPCDCGRARFNRISDAKHSSKVAAITTFHQENTINSRPLAQTTHEDQTNSLVLHGWSSRSPQRGAYMADAALRGDLELMKLLRSLGCSFAEAERFGPKVAFTAATHRHRHILDHLVSEGVLLANEIASDGSTLAHVAATQNNVWLLDLIYDQWARIMPDQPLIEVNACRTSRAKRSFDGKVKECAIHVTDTDFGPAGRMPFSGIEISIKCPYLVGFSSELPFSASGSASRFATDSSSGPSVDRATGPVFFGGTSNATRMAVEGPPANSFALFLSRLHKSCTAAMVAGILRHVDVLKWLQSHGDTQLNFQGEAHIGSGLAHLCGASGNLSMLRWLSSSGLSPYTCTEEGENVALIAARNGHLTILQYLHTEKSFDFASSNPAGESCVLLAAHHGHIDILQWLSSAGIILSEHRTNTGRSAIHTAAAAGELKTVKWLARNGLSIEDKTYLGYTIECMAAKEGHIHILEWLLSKGLSERSSVVDGSTPVLQAAFFGHLSVLKWYHRHGYSLKDRYRDGMSIAHIAACHGRLEMLTWLSSHGFSLNLESHSGATPLDMALQHQQQNIVAWLNLQGACTTSF